jgi:HEAT repeat
MKLSAKLDAEQENQLPRNKHGMSPMQKVLFFVVAWLICLMPFLFWWNTWFGRKLTDAQLNDYIHDTKKPRHIQQALVQVGERITHQDVSAKQWYADVVRLSSDPVEEVRNTDAWVMGQDTTGAGFHDALLKMLNDPSPMVRGNAALSLVRFGDGSGRRQIVALLQPAQIIAPQTGKIVDTDRPGTAIHQNGLIAKLKNGAGQVDEIRSPIPGRIRSVAGTGANLAAGTEIAVVDPSSEQVWEALRALYLIGQVEDIPAVLPYERELPDVSDDVRKQAVETERAIRERSRG